MCLIAFAWQSDPRYALVLATNRDEFHDRPSAAAAPAEDAPEVLGGRDLQAHGSWLLISAHGRLAAITNVRSGRPQHLAPKSRGALVADFARQHGDAQTATHTLVMHATDYGDCNLLFWDGPTLWHARNAPSAQAQAVPPGLHTLSNADLDTPWPKTRQLGTALAHWLDSPESDPSAPETAPLFHALSNTTQAADADLPATGVSLDWERRLSAAFILGETYGTRCSTVILVDREGRMQFEERRFGPHGTDLGSRRFIGKIGHGWDAVPSA